MSMNQGNNSQQPNSQSNPFLNANSSGGGANNSANSGNGNNSGFGGNNQQQQQNFNNQSNPVNPFQKSLANANGSGGGANTSSSGGGFNIGQNKTGGTTGNQQFGGSANSFSNVFKPVQNSFTGLQTNNNNVSGGGGSGNPQQKPAFNFTSGFGNKQQNSAAGESSNAPIFVNSVANTQQQNSNSQQNQQQQQTPKQLHLKHNYKKNNDIIKQLKVYAFLLQNLLIYTLLYQLMFQCLQIMIFNQYLDDDSYLFLLNSITINQQLNQNNLEILTQNINKANQDFQCKIDELKLQQIYQIQQIQRDLKLKILYLEKVIILQITIYQCKIIANQVSNFSVCIIQRYYKDIYHQQINLLMYYFFKVKLSLIYSQILIKKPYWLIMRVEQPNQSQTQNNNNSDGAKSNSNNVNASDGPKTPPKNQAPANQGFQQIGQGNRPSIGGGNLSAFSSFGGGSLAPFGNNKPLQNQQQQQNQSQQQDQSQQTTNPLAKMLTINSSSNNNLLNNKIRQLQSLELKTNNSNNSKLLVPLPLLISLENLGNWVMLLQEEEQLLMLQILHNLKLARNLYLTLDSSNSSQLHPMLMPLKLKTLKISVSLLINLKRGMYFDNIFSQPAQNQNQQQLNQPGQSAGNTSTAPAKTTFNFASQNNSANASQAPVLNFGGAQQQQQQQQNSTNSQADQNANNATSGVANNASNNGQSAPPVIKFGAGAQSSGTSGTGFNPVGGASSSSGAQFAFNPNIGNGSSAASQNQANPSQSTGVNPNYYFQHFQNQVAQNNPAGGQQQQQQQQQVQADNKLEEVLLSKSVKLTLDQFTSDLQLNKQAFKEVLEQTREQEFLFNQDVTTLQLIMLQNSETQKLLELSQQKITNVENVQTGLVGMLKEVDDDLNKALTQPGIVSYESMANDYQNIMRNKNLNQKKVQLAKEQQFYVFILMLSFILKPFIFTSYN